MPALFSVGILILRKNEPAPVVKENGNWEPSKSASGKKEKKETTGIMVDVGGDVKAPGVYEFSENERVVDALKRAGGATGDADLDLINLAARLEDGQKVLIPRKTLQPEAAPPAPGIEPQLGVVAPDSKINLNSATAEQLDEIDGIGPVLAERIVDYRKTKGSFSSVDQLREIEGIGEKKFARLKDRVSL